MDNSSYADFCDYNLEKDYYSTLITDIKKTKFHSLFDEKFQLQRKLFFSEFELKADYDFKKYFNDEKTKMNLFIKNKKKQINTLISEIINDNDDVEEMTVFTRVIQENNKLLKENQQLMSEIKEMKTIILSNQQKISKLEIKVQNYQDNNETKFTTQSLNLSFLNREFKEEKKKKKEEDMSDSVQKLNNKVSELECELQSYSNKISLQTTAIKTQIFNSMMEFSDKFIFSKIKTIEAGISTQLSENLKEYKNNLEILKREIRSNDSGNYFKEQREGKIIKQPLVVFENEMEEEKYFLGLKILKQENIEILDYSMENIEYLMEKNKSKILSDHMLKKLEALAWDSD